MIRVLLVDDQQLVRTGLARILRPKMGFEVVGECEDGDQVEQAVDELKPDVVVMDVRMRRMDGAEATRRLRERAGGDGAGSPPVLVLTTYDDDEVLAAALRAGAAGFQLKDAPGEDLLRSVRVVAEGGSWLDPGVTGRVLAAYRVQPRAVGAAGPAGPASAPSPEELTARECEVLKLMGRGLSNAEIAEQLVVSEVTVKTHIGHIFMKLALRDRAAAIVYAFDHGLVRPVDR
jgi:DNA-binding NarL/FixJ family response regulator